MKIDRRDLRWMIFLFLSAIAAQALILLGLNPGEHIEGDYSYASTAIMIRDRDLWTTFKPPVYTIVIAIPLFLTGFIGKYFYVYQIILFSFSYPLTYLLGKRLGLKWQVILLACLIELFYPYYLTIPLKYSDLVLVVTFTKLMLIFFLSLDKNWKRYFVFGIFWGIFTYLRPNIYSVLPALILFDIKSENWNIFKPIPRYLAMGAGIMVIAGPWMFFAYQQTGKPTLTTNNGGYNFLIGHNPLTYDYISSRKIVSPEFVRWDHPELFSTVNEMSQFERNDEDMRQGLKFAMGHPKTELALLKFKFIRYWDIFNVSTYPKYKRLMYSLTWGPILILGLIGMILAIYKGEKINLLFIGIQLFHMLPFLVFFSTIRMRVNLDFIMMFYTAYLIGSIVQLNWLHKLGKKLLPGWVSPLNKEEES